MTSKEQTIRKIEILKHESEKEYQENKHISLYSKLQLKYYEEVLEDLEKLEHVKILVEKYDNGELGYINFVEEVKEALKDE